MTDQEADLLAVIFEHPEDDAPRLKYSDWLIEDGQDARGEFIQVQCQIAGRPETVQRSLYRDETRQVAVGQAWFCNWCGSKVDWNVVNGGHHQGCQLLALLGREGELLTKYVTDWFPDLDGVMVTSLTERRRLQENISQWTFVSRGFISHVSFTAERWLARGDKISAPDPLPREILPSWCPVEEVTLTTWPTYTVEDLDGERIYPWGMISLKKRWPRVKKWNRPSTLLLPKPSGGGWLRTWKGK